VWVGVSGSRRCRLRRSAVPDLWAPRPKQTPPRQPYPAHVSGTIFRRLIDVFTERLHGYERRLAEIGGELKRIKECVGLPQHVMEETEALLEKYFDVVESLPSEVAAAALL
jgi:hypothetical protein